MQENVGRVTGLYHGSLDVQPLVMNLHGRRDEAGRNAMIASPRGPQPWHGPGRQGASGKHAPRVLGEAEPGG
jgi:hypothetical protein